MQFLLVALTAWVVSIVGVSALPLSNTSVLLSRSPNTTAQQPTTCNGSPLLCSKRYTDITFIGAHNSYSNGTSISSDQTRSVEVQLNSGIRLLQTQGHQYYSFNDDSKTNPSGIHLCHTSCLLLDGGSLEMYLMKVKIWLDANQNEVLTILFTNPDHQDIALWNRGIEYVQGLSDYTYVPPKVPMTRSDWPTLGEMISANKRLVFFMDYQANQSRVPYILDEFSQVYENPYDQVTLPFNCSRDRGRQNNTLYLHNHTKDVARLGVTIPDTDMLSVVNSALGEYGIVDTVQRCQRENDGVKATFVLVDFYDQPQKQGVFDAARVLNGLPPLNDTSGAMSNNSNGTASDGDTTSGGAANAQGE